jgi:hypothetical protein
MKRDWTVLWVLATASAMALMGLALAWAAGRVQP